MLQLTPPSDLNVLYYAGEYVPLAMFTQSNLSVLQLMGTSGKTHKAQMSVPSYKKTVSVRVVNVHDPRFSKEAALTYEDWRSATHTMIAWALTLHSDSVLLTGSGLTSTVLTFDIEMRLTYHRQPFAFQPAWHLDKFNEIRLHVQSLNLSLAAAPATTYGAGLLASEFYRSGKPSASSSRQSQGFAGSGQVSQASHPNTRPFQKGQSDETRPSHCLVCGNGGHHAKQQARHCLTAATPSAPRWNASGRAHVSCSSHSNSAQHLPAPSAVNARPSRFLLDLPVLPFGLTPSVLPSRILNRICTPYDADAFDAIFDEHPQLRTESPHLTDKLRHGFPMGIFPDLKETVIFPNNKSIDQHMDFVDEYFKEEVESGRMSGPYSQEELEGILGGPFQCSPLSIDEKEVDGSFETKLRMCINLSKGTDEHPSVNSFSDKADFPTNYDPATFVADLVANAPPGTKAMVMDISKFHRRTPICPAHKKWFVMQGRPGEYYLQHCCPFGATGSESNSGQISKVVLQTWSVRGIKPNVASTKTPWHPLSKKGQPFRPAFDYVGMVWDLDSKSVAVKEEKRTRFLFRADVFRAKVCTRQVTEQEAMEIHGSLCHIAFVYRQGRSRLASLSTFIAEFHKYRPGKPLFAKKSVIDDIEWWVDALRVPNFSRPLVSLGDIQDLGISVDASTDWGIGLKWGDDWDAWRVKDGWKGPWRDIGWLECLAIELLVLRLEERGLHDCRIRVLSDNQGIIGAFWKGRSRNVQVNFSIRRFMAILDSLHISLEVEYVKSEDNPADPVSRGIVGPSSRQLTPTVPLPPELESYLFHHHA
ncbi:hypothetical protein NMY22_g19622 [Coprinellus aureogranulatus]|nr:hypothetical protein NMY22_g19622 [Coprinellus aureogranulatus]